MQQNMDLVKKAEIEAINQLKQAGWNITRWDPESEGSKDIEAVAGPQKILVKVQTAKAPNEPPHLTQPEMENFKYRAMQQNAKSYQARVKLDENLNRMGNIGWMRLN